MQPSAEEKPETLECVESNVVEGRITDQPSEGDTLAVRERPGLIIKKGKANLSPTGDGLQTPKNCAILLNVIAKNSGWAFSKPPRWFIGSLLDAATAIHRRLFSL